MEETGWGALLCAYLRRNVKTILLLGLFTAILFFLPVLYGVPAEALGYALFLCLLVGSGFFAWGFFRFRQKHLFLREMVRGAGLWAGRLPAAGDVLEQDYADMAGALEAVRRGELSRAEARERELREYFTTWVHQIKTPIAAIDLLLQTEETVPRGELSAQLFRVEEYVGMVLQYLRADAISSDLVLRNCALDDVLRQAVHRYAGEFIRKKLTLRYQPVGVTVLTDEKWLLFVLEQLLSNALKYTKSGGVSIYMEPGEAKTLVVEDTGMGIAPEDLPRVLERGFTGYNGRGGSKSTGIGLSLCQRVLTGLSHTIRVTSEPGRGTRVLLGLDTRELAVE